MSKMSIPFLNEKPVRTFLLSGKAANIEVFFSLNSMELFQEKYYESGDYRYAFAQIAYSMYQEGKYSVTALTEGDFIAASDNELVAILSSILEMDEKLSEKYTKTPGESPYERFYIANSQLIKEALEPLKVITEKYKIPDFSSFLNVQKLTLKINTTAIVDTMQGLNHIFSQIASSIPKYTYPNIVSILDSIPKISFNVEEIIKPIISLVEEPMRVLSSNLTTILSTIDFSLLTNHVEWSEKHDFLLQFDWFYLNELSKETVDEIFI